MTLRILGWAAVFVGVGVRAYALQETLSETRFHRVYLKNGNFLDGQLAAQTPTEVTLRLGIGQMSIRRDQIDRVEWIKMRTRGEPAPPWDKDRSVAPDAFRKPREETLSASAKPPETNLPPLVLAEAVSPKLRREVDVKVHSAAAGRGDHPEILAQELVTLGPLAVPYLGALVSQRPQEVPVPALCLALGRLGDPRAVPALKQVVLQSAVAGHRVAAVGALGSLGTKEAIALLLGSLKDEDAQVWTRAGKELVELSRRGVIPDLARLLTEEMKGASDKAAFAITLGRLGGPEARESLLDLLGQSAEASQLAALQGIREMLDPQDGAAVLSALRSPRGAVRMEACLVLGRLKYQPAIPELIGLLNYEEAGVVLNAHWALRQMTDQKFPPDADLWAAWWDNWNRYQKR
jgi:HEAT repeat protein